MFDDAFNTDRDQQLAAFISASQFQQALELLEAWYAGEPWNGEVLMRMAVVHWLAGEPAHTLRDLDAYLAMDPENAEALARRAQALLMLGKREDAEVSLAKAEALDPLSPGVLLNRALLQEEQGRYADAVDKLSGYLELVPTDHLALARRSHLYRQLGAYAQALTDAQTCVQMHPEDPETHFAEALARVTLEQGDAALAACDRSLCAQPAFLPAFRLKIDLLADLGQVQEAAAMLARLQERDPDSPQTYLLNARIAVEEGNFPVALQWVNRFLDDAPDEAHGLYRRGMIYFRMGEYARAVEDFQQYTQLLPNAIEGYEQLLMCYLEMGRPAEAGASGAQAIALQPDSYRLQYNLAFARLLQGEAEGAKTGFLQAIRLAPDEDELLLRIYLAYVEHAAMGVRLDFLRAAVERAAQSPAMLQGLLAESYLENGQLEQAIPLARQVMTEARERPFGYLIAIKGLCMSGRYDEAMTVADTGIAVLPADGQLRLARALILRDTGWPEAALHELEQAAQLLPDDPEVARQRALVYGSVGQVEEAVAQLHESLRHGEVGQHESYFWLGYFLLHLQRYRDALAAAEQLLALLPASAEGHLLRGAALRGLQRDTDANAEVQRVWDSDPTLLARMNVDPIMAELLTMAPSGGIIRQVRRTISRRWQGIRRTWGYKA
jgi:tetratricopeptide (TPR) repeat protein